MPANPDPPLATATDALAATTQSSADQIDHLTASQKAIAAAVLALRRATTNNHAGYVEKARANIEQATNDMNAATAYAGAHPELAGTPLAESPASSASIAAIQAFDFPKPNNQASMVAALKSIQTAASTLEQAPGGNLGGYRDKLIADLNDAANNVNDGFNVLRSGGRKTQPPNTRAGSDTSMP